MAEGTFPKDVVDRFEQSRSVLDGLSDKLRELKLVEEAQRDDHAALRDAGQALADLARQLETFLIEARKAIESADGVSKSAAAVLDASDAKALYDRLERLSAEISAAADQGRADYQETSQRLAQFEARFAALEERLDTADEAAGREALLREQLDKVRTGLSARQLKKVGLAE